MPTHEVNRDATSPTGFLRPGMTNARSVTFALDSLAQMVRPHP